MQTRLSPQRLLRLLPSSLLTPALSMAITLVLSMAACHVAGAAEFRAGAAVGDITPTKWPVFQIGSFGERPAEKAWDPLSARALVLDDGTTKLAIVVVDSCLIPRVLFDKAKAIASKATGIRRDRMLMAATHTHSAPASLDRPVAKASEDYLKVLVDGIVEAIKQANSNLEPAMIGWGQVDVPEHVHNRRWYMKPGGIVANPFGETTDQVRMNPPSSLIDRPAGPVDPQVFGQSGYRADRRCSCSIKTWGYLFPRYTSKIPASISKRPNFCKDLSGSSRTFSKTNFIFDGNPKYGRPSTTITIPSTHRKNFIIYLCN